MTTPEIPPEARAVVRINADEVMALVTGYRLRLSQKPDDPDIATIRMAGMLRGQRWGRNEYCSSLAVAIRMLSEELP